MIKKNMTSVRGQLGYRKQNQIFLIKLIQNFTKSRTKCKSEISNFKQYYTVILKSVDFVAS